VENIQKRPKKRKVKLSSNRIKIKNNKFTWNYRS